MLFPFLLLLVLLTSWLSTPLPMLGLALTSGPHSSTLWGAGTLFYCVATSILTPLCGGLASPTSRDVSCALSSLTEALSLSTILFRLFCLFRDARLVTWTWSSIRLRGLVLLLSGSPGHSWLGPFSSGW